MTIKLKKIIRRELPNGDYVSIGPKGLIFGKKWKREKYPISWDAALERAMSLFAAEAAAKPLPLIEDNNLDSNVPSIFTPEELSRVFESSNVKQGAVGS